MTDKDEICKRCVTNEVWRKAFPTDLLSKCENCNEVGFPLTNLYKASGAISIFVYLFLFLFSLLSN